MPLIIACDFDGVIHWYRDGWRNGKIYDEPVPGALSWIREITVNKDLELHIFSSRSKSFALKEAMEQWVHDQLKRAFGEVNGQRIYERIKFPFTKPPAFLSIDDRAMCFTGEFPTVEAIAEFKTWIDKKHEDN